MSRIREDELDYALDLPQKESMRESKLTAAERRNMSTDDKKSNRRAQINKESAEESKVHMFEDSHGAYGRTQSDDRIKSGDVFHIPSEQITGYMHKAWPVAVTTNKGEFHGLEDPASWAGPKGEGHKICQTCHGSGTASPSDNAPHRKEGDTSCWGCGGKGHYPGDSLETVRKLHEGWRKANELAQQHGYPVDHRMHVKKQAMFKEALSLSPSKGTSYSSPGYYVTDKYGAPQDGPYQTYSLAIANLNGRDAIQFMDQSETAPMNEPFPPQFNTVMGSKKEALSDDRINDAYERHIRWSKDNGHEPDTVKALKAHEKARGITRAEANGIADLQGIGGGDTNWRSQAHQDEPWRTASMSIQHREAELLERMARNPHEASSLMVELEAIRRDERLKNQASREVDLANALISDLRTPVVTYSHHTAATDWMGQDTSVDPAEVTNRIITSASLWYSKLSPEVRADRDEFLAQAEGYFRREASQYGPMAHEAFQMAMSHVDEVNRINRTASDTLLPWSAVLPPLPPSNPVGPDMNTNHVPGPGYPGQPMPWSNDAEHASQPGSPSTTEAMGQAGQVDYFYPNQDATAEPNDDGMLGAGRGKQAASYATGPYATPIDLNDTWLNQPAPMVAQEQGHTNPAEVASASSRNNLAFYPNQDATDEPNDDGADNYGSSYSSQAQGGFTASLQRLGDEKPSGNSEEEIARMNEELSKDRSKQRNHPKSRTASTNFNGPKTTYDEYLQKISEGATPVSREFWSGMAAAISPNDATSRRQAVRRTAADKEESHPHAYDNGDSIGGGWGSHDVPCRTCGKDANHPDHMFKTSASFGQEPQDRDDPSGSQIGNNPAAWNGGAADPQQAYAQSGAAQSSLPYAPQGSMAQNWGNISDFPDTGPTEVNPDALNRYSRLHQAGRPKCGLCGSYGHSEEAHDDDPLYANWTDTRPWGKRTKDDSVWGYPEDGREIGRPRVAGKNDDPAGDDGKNVDRSLYAQSPGGHQNQDNQSYSSDRHVNWTDMPQGPPEVSDHAAGGVPTSFLGTVPVQGYAQDAEHPSGEMWPWTENAPGSGAADVAGVPTPGIQSQMATGNSWPQPQVNQDR